MGARAEGAKSAFVRASEGAWTVSEMCSALKVTRQGCYAWRSRGPSARDEGDAELASRITEIHAASRGIYGAPKVFQELGKAGAHLPQARGAHHARERPGRHDARLRQAPRGR